MKGKTLSSVSKEQERKKRMEIRPAFRDKSYPSKSDYIRFYSILFLTLFFSLRLNHRSEQQARHALTLTVSTPVPCPMRERTGELKKGQVTARSDEEGLF